VPAHNATTNQHGTTVTDPDGNTLKCRGASVSAGNAPGVLTVELTYARADASLVIKGPIDNPRSIRLVREDIPIDDERLLDTNGGVFTAAQILTAKETGYRTLPLYGVEYEYTRLDASFAWTEAAIFATIQENVAPTGLAGTPTAANWELVGKEIDETDTETIIREHYRFSGPGFLPLKA
jgi:hypothetical protein